MNELSFLGCLAITCYAQSQAQPVYSSLPRCSGLILWFFTNEFKGSLTH